MAKNEKVFREYLKNGFLVNGDSFTEKQALEYNASERLNLAIPCVIALYQQEKARYNGVTPYEYMQTYIAHKMECYRAGDKGARGDAIETLVRYYIRKRWINYNDVRVKNAGQVDINSRKNGAIEVGQNGKTFQSAYAPNKKELTTDGLMNGDYTILIYGAFKKDYDLTKISESAILKTMRVFTDKYKFPLAIAGKHGIASGWNIAHGKATVQYNDSLRYRFEEYCENNGIPTLGEWLEGKG